jgi:hypothetical protein
VREVGKVETIRSCTRWLVPAVLVLLIGGCGGFVEAFFINTASLGGQTAHIRGTMRVLIINNTPYSATFTVGAYDHTDQTTVPTYVQYGLTNLNFLGGDSQTPIQDFPCTRACSVGGAEMLGFLERNLPEEDYEALAEDASIVGVEFWGEPEGEDGESPSIGLAAPLDVFIGADYACNALLIFRLEFNDVGPYPFRVDFEVIPSKSTR